jgi:molybdenum cofactor cytidylyltransferase
MAVAAILLAADASPHFDVPPALLPWGTDETLIEYQIAELRAAGVDVIEVVLGYQAERVIPLVARDDVEPVVNARWAAGLAGSLRTGATAVPRDTETAIIVRIHQPRLADVYRRLLEHHASGGAPISRPAYHGVAGSPLVVGREALAELRNVTGEGKDLDAFLGRHARAIGEFELGTDIVLLDFVTRDEYERARLAFGLGG